MPQQTLIFLGPQGCGKGTQIELLKKYLLEKDPSQTIIHFEMGKTLRDLSTQTTFSGRHTKDILAQGGLIPYAISASSFAQSLMNSLVTNEEHIMIDGFPRTATQVPMLDSALVEFYGRKNPTVVVLNISDEEAIRRSLLRGRSDDTEENLRKRLMWSRDETMPNIEWFKTNQNYKVIEVFGERPIEEVQQDIRTQLGL